MQFQQCEQNRIHLENAGPTEFIRSVFRSNSYRLGRLLKHSQHTVPGLRPFTLSAYGGVHVQTSLKRCKSMVLLQGCMLSYI